MTPELFTEWRGRLKLTIKDAADALGCSRNTVARWERGETAIPRYIALAASALALGLPPYGER